MPYFISLGSFKLNFRRSEQQIASGEYLSLSDELGRAGVEQGALREVSAEEAQAAPAPASVESEPEAEPSSLRFRGRNKKPQYAEEN